jgi:flagellar motor switch/type III secretory pathway protein FliN
MAAAIAPPMSTSSAKAALPGTNDPFAAFLHIPAAITIDVPVVALTVRDLFRLEKGSIVVTSQPSGANVPVQIASTLVAWGEFQVFTDKLAVRLTELV